MTARLRSARPRLLPVLQYRDLPGAIAWLKRAFGFAEHEISWAKDGTILHAMLTLRRCADHVGTSAHRSARGSQY